MSTLLRKHHQPNTAPKRRDRSPAAAILGLPVVVPRWSLILGLIVATLREWRRRHVGRRDLANLDERALRDLGLDPGVVNYEVRQPFWRPPRDWRD